MLKEGRYSLIYFANIAYELGKWAFVVIIIGTLVHYFLFTIFIINGPSMEPNLHNGQIVLVSRIGLFTGKYQRGDPMVIKFPGDPDHKKYIKRLIGMPGETLQIKNNEVLINEQPLLETYIKPVAPEFLPYFYENPSDEEEAMALHDRGKVLIKPDLISKIGSNEYFLMGDNRENSNDSRKWYPAPKQDMIGPVRFILWPIKDWGPVANPSYNTSN